MIHLVFKQFKKENLAIIIKKKYVIEQLDIFHQQMHTSDMQKDKFVTQTWFQPKVFYPKKCVNYNKSNL